VLAVLLVNRPGVGPVIFTGMNMEVSMPTGSLCAERNVIGTALASDSSIRRQDFVMVAVLAVTLPNENPILSPPQLPSPPPGTNTNVCTIIDPKDQSMSRTRETSDFFSEVEEKLARYQRPENMRRSLSMGSFASIVEGSDSHEIDDSSWDKMSGNERAPHSPPPVIGEKMGLFTTQSIPEVISKSHSMPSFSGYSSGVSTPIRKIKLYGGGETNSERRAQKSKSGIFRRKKKKTVIVHNADDINPLKPCGACNEWLKKIAESNPYFKVITFTDTDCSGVYVTPCQE